MIEGTTFPLSVLFTMQFKKGLRETGVHLSEEALQALFRNFDADCSGYISFDEFLYGVRPEMSDKRKALVLTVFKQMDINNDGALTVQDVSGRYDCSIHPEVRSKECSFGMGFSKGAHMCICTCLRVLMKTVGYILFASHRIKECAGDRRIAY